MAGVLLPSRSVIAQDCQKNWEAIQPYLRPEPVPAWNAGDIKPTFATTAPAGWLMLDGSSVTSTAYPDLAAALGVSGTFNLPDARGRTLIGSGTGTGLTARTLNTTGGSETHVLVVGEIPSHNHGGSTGTSIQSLNHSHLVNGNGNNTVRDGAGGTAASLQVGGSSYVRDNPLTSAVDLTSHTHPVSSQGGGGGHNNMQPWLSVNWLIKT